MKMKRLGWLAFGMVITSFGWAAEGEAPKVEKGPAYLGMTKCKMCHKPYFESWGKTVHAKTLESLEKCTPEQAAKRAEALGVKLEGKASESPECLKCHVTGYGREGGYTAATGKKDLSDAVACEACHGAGGLHMKAKKEDKPKTIMGHPGEAECVVCHTKAMSPEFKFEEYAKKGLHESFKKK